MTNEEIRKLFKDKSFRDNYREYVGLETSVTLGKQIRDNMQEIVAEQKVVIAQQNAKIYAYEAIIANSNFKAVLPKKGEK